MPISETSHSKNIANLETLISATAAFGAAYHPGRDFLKISGLEILLHDAKLAMKEVTRDQAMLIDASHRRELAFDGLDQLVGRVGGVLEIHNLYRVIGDDAKSVVCKLQCASVAPNPADIHTTPADQYAKSVSISPMSFDSRLAHFEKLLRLLEAQTGYAPCETDLTTAALRRRLSDMETKNAAAVSAAMALSSSRMVRAEVLYDEESGLVTIANLVKDHVKAAFGSHSPQYRQISHLEFRKP